MVKRYIFFIFLALQTNGLLVAFNPVKTVIGFYAKTCKPFTWYASSFRSLEDDERMVVIDTLKMLEVSIVKGLKWTDKGNIRAIHLEKISSLVYPYLWAKTWSKEQSTTLLTDIINPVYMIAHIRFACEYNVDYSPDIETMITQSGVSREKAIHRIYVIMLETVRSCLSWTGRKAGDKKEFTVNLPVKISLG